MLVFTESILIAQYVYQIPSRLHCSPVTPRVRALAEEAGLHGNALRGVPIFCVYLATLMHTYSLARQKVPALQESMQLSQNYATWQNGAFMLELVRLSLPTLMHTYSFFARRCLSLQDLMQPGWQFSLAICYHIPAIPVLEWSAIHAERGIPVMQ